MYSLKNINVMIVLGILVSRHETQDVVVFYVCATYHSLFWHNPLHVKTDFIQTNKKQENDIFQRNNFP